jgi:hypothetical protein
LSFKDFSLPIPLFFRGVRVVFLSLKFVQLVLNLRHSLAIAVVSPRCSSCSALTFRDFIQRIFAGGSSDESSSGDFA